MIQALFGRQSAVRRVLTREVAALFGDRRGNIAALFALLLVPLVGILSLAFETSGWFLVKQAMQSSADSAALAAAANGDGQSGVTYQKEAKAVAANSGFTDGSNHTTVTPTYVACPSPVTGNCYQVKIRRDVPLYLVGLLGYKGTSNDGGLQEIQATAYASANVVGQNFCALALAPTGTSVTQNGGTMTLNGCSVQVNSSGATAFNQTGGTFSAQNVEAVGTISHTANFTAVTGTDSPLQDPYHTLYSDNSVSSLVTHACQYNGLHVPANGPISAGYYCNSLMVSSGATLGSGVYLIQGGTFAVNGGTVTGSNVTIILTCGSPPCTSSSSSWANFSQSNGTLNLSAPTTGAWKGVLFYQDPTEPSTKNTPSTINGGSNSLVGALYFPTQKLNFTSDSGSSTCTHIVAWQIQFTGGTMNSSCAGTGVANIGAPTQRQALVQ